MFGLKPSAAKTNAEALRLAQKLRAELNAAQAVGYTRSDKHILTAVADIETALLNGK